MWVDGKRGWLGEGGLSPTRRSMHWEELSLARSALARNVGRLNEIWRRRIERPARMTGLGLLGG